MQSERLIHATASHGYLLTVDIAPEHEMEKVLYAVDELTGLIGAVALMRPSKSTLDLELKSVKKKYKALNFAAGCSREVIQRGADRLDARRPHFRHDPCDAHAGKAAGRVSDTE